MVSQTPGATGEQVKVVLKRVLANGRPDIAHIARELGLGERTLQRRITKEGTSFRTLLSEARLELGPPLLTNPTLDVGTIALMLGYTDTSSFYRAFKEWTGFTPKKWRTLHGGEQRVTDDDEPKPIRSFR